MSTMQRLILALEGEHGERMGGEREHVFDCRDGSIGRSEECDWVLSAEGVSRLHGLVRYLNGLYFIEDRSTNGMLLNGTALRKGDPAALKYGDRLQIDTFEIAVRLSGETQTEWTGSRHEDASMTASSPAAAVAAPASSQNVDVLDLSQLLAPRRADTSADTDHDEGLIPGATTASASGASLDPLALFDAPPSYFGEAACAEPPAQGWSHTPAVADRFRPPQVEAVRTGGPMLPDDWDRTDSRVAPHVEWHRDESSLAPVARVMPIALGLQQVAEASGPWEGQPQPPAGPEATSTPFAPISVSLPPPTPESGSGSESESTAGPTLSSIPGPAPSPPLSPTSAATSMAPASPMPAQLAVTPTAVPAPAVPVQPAASNGAGLPDMAEMFHIAVDAMMDVLRARAELKNSFRLPATLIQRSENNPLKFAPTAQDAVKKLFAPADSGFLSGSAALNDAADDIRNHQMAMLAGVRSAFQSVLAHFDPARIEQETDGGARRLPLGGRPRYWERYREQFDALTRNPDECFRRLFGDEFARAYEEQLVRLKQRRH